MLQHRHDFAAMGCPCTLHLYAEKAGQLQHWSELGEAEVRRLETKYSRYRDDSVTAAIADSAGTAQGIAVDAETARLLDYAATAWAQSDGLFDLSSGLLRKAWDFHATRLPSQAEVAALLPHIGWDKLSWAAPRLHLPQGMQLDFGGLVKEYAVDCVTQQLVQAGCRHGLVDLGGDLRVLGPHPQGQPWQLGVRNPAQPDQAIAQVPLRGGALATSGNYERSMVVVGQRYGHILNPKTGWPVMGVASVSVLADLCLVAGSASTIALLLGAEDGAAWLQTLGLPWLLVTEQGALLGTMARD